MLGSRLCRVPRISSLKILHEMIEVGSWRHPAPLMVAKTMIPFLLPQGELLVQLRLNLGTLCLACMVHVLLSRRRRGGATRASRPGHCVEVTASRSLAPTSRIKKRAG